MRIKRQIDCQQSLLTDEDLVKKLREIDLRDGVLDGRVKPEHPVVCPGCNKKMKKGASTCVYCGSIIPVDYKYQKSTDLLVCA